MIKNNQGRCNLRKNELPLISVILPAYNCSVTISEAIDSIINQTYQNWELIVCDDCSTDETYSILKKYKNILGDKMILLQNEKNSRIAATLNHCLKYVHGDYVARMDGDDLSEITRFEEQVNFLINNPQYDLVGSQMTAFDEDGDIGIISTREIPDRYSLRYNTPFCHATIMIKKEVYVALKGYTVSNNIKRCEDVDLWFRFFYKGFIGYNLQQPLYKVRTRKEDYKRRTFSHSIEATKVCLKGFRLLNYPVRYYIFILKPLISGVIPGSLMKRIHDSRMKLILM